tara:strand:- start:609 stop:791 length:183 start_codon:yes stop_codon:yes gene_type:complete
MQHRLNPLRKKNSSLTNTLIKAFIILSILGFIFYFLEKIELPSPKKEIQQDVTDKIIRIK